MIFEPYEDELQIINQVHRHNENDYILIRLTPTMIEKNNIDANGLFRDLLKKYGVVDYDALENGGQSGQMHTAKFISRDRAEDIEMNFYKVSNKRSDRRFSIYGIKKLFQDRKVHIGDLLYISLVTDGPFRQIVILNTTKNTPTESILLRIFGVGAITDSASRLIPAVVDIARAGFHPNSKGSGKISPKDVGDTLEYLLGIQTNNNASADFEGKIEIKAKTGKTLDTLFTLRPQFEGTTTEKIEPIDRSRVSAFTRLYGYDSTNHPGYKNLYITIGTKIASQNTIGFFLEVNEEDRKVELKRWIDEKRHETTAYWTFDRLWEELHKKHPATLWVKAEQRIREGTVEFRYYKAELSREPQFLTFLTLIESGGITYDWRGYTTPAGKYQGKNHGNAWRIKRRYRELLFGSIEEIDLL